MGHQFVGFFETVLVEQKPDALAGRHLALLVLLLLPCRASAFLRQLIAPLQLLELRIDCHEGHRPGLSDRIMGSTHPSQLGRRPDNQWQWAQGPCQKA